MDKRTAIKIIKKYIKFLQENNYEVQKAYIFGSYAKGNYDDNSDIDLAIILKNLKNGFNIQLLLKTQSD